MIRNSAQDCLARLKPHKESVPDAIRAFGLYFSKFEDSIASRLGSKDGVIGRPSLWIAEDFGAALQADSENEVRGDGLKHQKEKRSMDHFAGLDVSVKETSICIVDDTGRIVREVKVASEPEALLKVLGNPAYRFKRIGLEAGPLSQWLFSALAEAGFRGLNLPRQT
jgi:hypothetical protein